MSLFKKKTHRDKDYLEFVKSKPCIICGQTAEPHHVETAGKGLKCSDYKTVPLCRICHTYCHSMGKLTFQTKHLIDFKDKIISLMEEYINEK